jgi:hypothetical protein
MEAPRPYISEEYRSRRHYQPVVCLLLWAIALQGNPAREFLEAIGVTQDEVESMTDGMEPELAEMRRLRIASELFDRERLGQLLRARLAEMLMQCHRPGELAQLAKAAQRLPAWAFDGNAAAPEVAHNNKRARTGARHAPAHTAARHAHTPAGEHNGAGHTVCEQLNPEDFEDEDCEFPLGVKENGEAYTAVELVGELNGMLAEIQRLDDAKAMLDGFSKRDLRKELEPWMVPEDRPPAGCTAADGPATVDADESP